MRQDVDSGLELIRKGRFLQAWNWFKKLNRRYPNAVDPHYYRGLSALHKGNHEKAAAAFLDALNIDDTHGMSLSFLAYMRLENGVLLESALEDSRKAWELLPDEPSVVVNYAWTLFRLGDRKDAYSLIRSAIEKDPGNGLFHYRLGMMYFFDNLYQFAIGKFDEVLKLYDQWPKPMMMKGLALARLGRDTQALTSLSQSLDLLSAHGTNRRIVVKTIENLKLAISNPDGYTPLSMSDSSSTGSLGNGAVSAVTVEDAVKNKQAWTILENAVTAAVSGQLKRAEGLLTQGAEDYPRYADISIDLGFLKLLTGKEDQAKAHFDNVLDFHSSDFRALSGYGHLSFNAGNMERFAAYIEQLSLIPPTTEYSKLLKEMILRWEQVVSINKNDPAIWYELGRILLFAGSTDRGIECLKKGEGPLKDNLLGELYLRKYVSTRDDGDFALAETHLKKAGYPWVKDLKQIKSLLDHPEFQPEKAKEILKYRLGDDDLWTSMMRAAFDKTGTPLYSKDFINMKRFSSRWTSLDSKLLTESVAARSDREKEAKVAAALRKAQVDNGRLYFKVDDGEIRLIESGGVKPSPSVTGDSTAPTVPATSALLGVEPLGEPEEVYHCSSRLHS